MEKWEREEEERRIVGGSWLTPHLRLKLCWISLEESQSRRVIPCFLRHLREDPCPTWATQAEDGIEIGGLVSWGPDPCCRSPAAAKGPSPPRGLGTYPESADYTKLRENERPQDVRDYQHRSQRARWTSLIWVNTWQALDVQKPGQASLSPVKTKKDVEDSSRNSTLMRTREWISFPLRCVYNQRQFSVDWIVSPHNSCWISNLLRTFLHPISMWGERLFTYHQAILQHQLSILQFNSILTLSTQR